ASWDYAACSNITACSSACQGNTCGVRTYSITTPASCDGAACPYADGATETCYGTLPAVNCSGYVDYSSCSQISACVTTCPETVCGYRKYHITTPASCGGTACQYTDNYVLETCYGTKANDAYVGDWTITGGCGTDGCNICRKPQKRYCVAGSCASFTCSGSPPGTVMDTSCNISTDCYDAYWSTAYYMLGGCGTGGCATNRVPVAKMCQGNCGTCDGTAIGSLGPQLGCQLASNFGVPTVDCVGSWGTCTGATSCENSGTQTYTITTPASCGGTACPYSNGATQSCGGVAGRTAGAYCGYTTDTHGPYTCACAPVYVPANCSGVSANGVNSPGYNKCTHRHNFNWDSTCSNCNVFSSYSNAAGTNSCSPCYQA
ncbi:MAG: hypothetical protein PHV43_02155, partial [Candidatus Colwellbacteria bacterium]|nr:hypothetical protein [Candidatus Colwellbacteria bacterium]